MVDQEQFQNLLAYIVQRLQESEDTSLTPFLLNLNQYIADEETNIAQAVDGDLVTTLSKIETVLLGRLFDAETRVANITNLRHGLELLAAWAEESVKGGNHE